MNHRTPPSYRSSENASGGSAVRHYSNLGGRTPIGMVEKQRVQAQEDCIHQTYSIIFELDKKVSPEGHDMYPLFCTLILVDLGRSCYAPARMEQVEDVINMVRLRARAAPMQLAPIPV